MKKDTLAQMFSCEFLRTLFLQNTSGRLLLLIPEAVTRRCSDKMVFLTKFLKFTEKHVCIGVLSIILTDV